MSAAFLLALLALFLRLIDSARIEHLEKSQMTLDDEITQLQADADAVKAKVADLASQLAAESAKLSGGSPLTADQQAKFNAIHAELAALASSAAPTDPAPAPAP